MTNHYKEKFYNWLKNQSMECPPSGHLDDIFNISTINSEILDYSLKLLDNYNGDTVKSKILTLCIYLKESKKTIDEISKLKIKMLSSEPPEFIFQYENNIPKKEIFIENFPVNLKYYLGEAFDNDNKLYYPYIVVKR